MNDKLKQAEEFIILIMNYSDCYGGLEAGTNKNYYEVLAEKAKWQLLSLISQLVEENLQYKQLANEMHYPGCWDIMAYPTLFDAVNECVGPCNICQNKQKREKALDNLTALSQEMGDYE